MSLQQQLLDQVVSLTKRLNDIENAAKTNAELPLQNPLQLASTIRAFYNGNSETITVQNIIDKSMSLLQPFMNRFVSTTGFILSEQDLTMNANWTWYINGSIFTNPNPITINIPFSEEGMNRIDLIAANVAGNFVRIPGVESIGIPVAPELPANMLQATFLTITDGTISEPEEPTTIVPGLSEVLLANGREIKEISALEYQFIDTDKSVSIVVNPNADLVTVLLLDAGVFPNNSDIVVLNNSAGEVYIVAGEGVTFKMNGFPTDGFVIVKNVGILTKVSNSADEWVFSDISPAQELPTTDLEFVTSLGGRTPYEVEVYNSSDPSTFIKMFTTGSLEAYKGAGFARFSPDRLLIREPSGRYLDYYNGKLFLKSTYDSGLLSFSSGLLPEGTYFQVTAPNRPNSTGIFIVDLLVNGHVYTPDATGRVNIGLFEEYFIKNTTPTTPVTGTTAQTIFYAEKIPAGTARVGSKFTAEFQLLETKAAAGGTQISFYIGNSPTDIDPTRILGTYTRASANSQQPIERTFKVVSSAKISHMNGSLSAANDKNITNVGWEEKDFFMNSDQWLIGAVALGHVSYIGFGNFFTLKGVR